MRLRFGIGADRRAGGDPAQDRQRFVVAARPRRGRIEPFAFGAPGQRLAQPGRAQTDAARAARQQFDQPVLVQRLQVVAGGAVLAEAEARADLLLRRRQAVGGEALVQEGEQGTAEVGQAHVLILVIVGARG